MKLEKKLDEWFSQELISSHQHRVILQYEDDKESLHWLLYGFLILGAVITGIGIISLIAANWASIPANIKLWADFSVLLFVAIALYYFHVKKRFAAFETLLVIFLLLCLSSIGLISQIFHTGSDWYQALLFWSLISFPIVLYSRQPFAPFLWVSLFLSATIWTITEQRVSIVQEFFEVDHKLIAAVLLAPLFCGLLTSLSHRIERLKGLHHNFYFWFMISAIMALSAADLLYSLGESESFNGKLYLPAWLVASLLMIGILIRKDYRILNKGLLISTLILFMLFYHPNLLFTGETLYNWNSQATSHNLLADDIRAPLLTLVILFLYAIHVGILGHKRIFNLVTFLIGLRFLILYFQAMGGLAATGIGLIISGLLIILVVYVWYRSKDQLGIWVKRLGK